MKRFSIYKIQFKTMMKSKESGKNIIKIRRIYKKIFRKQKNNQTFAKKLDYSVHK